MMPNAKPDKDFPYWLLLIIGAGLFLFYKIWVDPVYWSVLQTLSAGIVTTLLVTLVSYSGACVLGLGLAVAGMSRFIVLRQVARAIFALILAYSAFLAEIFRAGLQAVDKGQIEAAQALGLTGWQRFRHIVFPQAFRMILPPLGNDFVAMVKDSSLVAVLGVGDVAQLGKVTAAGNFRYFETYNVVALIYLTMTISLSLILRRFERRMRDRITR